MMTEVPAKITPMVSVVVEGYNEIRGAADNTMDALKKQDYPLDRVEVILVGSASQVAEWQEQCRSSSPFVAIKTVAADGALYYELKNKGAEYAEGDLIAFTDSDLYPKPTWLSAAVETISCGADVAVGLSLFKSLHGWDSDSILSQIAVSITFGYILGKIRAESSSNNQLPDVEVRGFMDHNLVMKAEVFRQFQYRTDLGRVCASPLLFRTLDRAGAKIALHPKQQVVHFFAWRYWLHGLHFRYGHEVYRLRRLDPDYPNQWIARTWILEPLVTMGWHILLDIPRWLRFSKLWGMKSAGRWAVLPIVIFLSTVARSAEMAGMYCTMVAPNAMRQWAQTV